MYEYIFDKPSHLQLILHPPTWPSALTSRTARLASRNCFESLWVSMDLLVFTGFTYTQSHLLPSSIFLSLLRSIVCNSCSPIYLSFVPGIHELLCNRSSSHRAFLRAALKENYLLPFSAAPLWCDSRTCNCCSSWGLPRSLPVAGSSYVSTCENK